MLGHAVTAVVHLVGAQMIVTTSSGFLSHHIHTIFLILYHLGQGGRHSF